MFGGRGVAAAFLSLLMLALAGAAYAQTPPQIPQIPGLGKPDDSATFRVVVEGVQSSGTSIFFSTTFGQCGYEVNIRAQETWRFLRGKGTEFVFDRYGRTVFLRRKGRRFGSGDLTFATRGTVSRTVEGGYNEPGPAPCRGAFPASQETCGTKHKVNSALALFWDGRRNRVEVTNTRKNSFLIDDETHPARKCGTDGRDVDQTLFAFRYPAVMRVKMKRALSRSQIFGSRRALVLNGVRTAPETGQGVKGKTSVDVTLRLIRVGR